MFVPNLEKIYHKLRPLMSLNTDSFENKLQPSSGRSAPRYFMVPGLYLTILVIRIDLFPFGNSLVNVNTVIYVNIDLKYYGCWRNIWESPRKSFSKEVWKYRRHIYKNTPSLSVTNHTWIVAERFAPAGALHFLQQYNSGTSTHCCRLRMRTSFTPGFNYLLTGLLLLADFPLGHV